MRGFRYDVPHPMLPRVQGRAGRVTGAGVENQSNFYKRISEIGEMGA